MIGEVKWEAISWKEEVKLKAKKAALTVKECDDTLRDLFLAAEEGATFNDIMYTGRVQEKVGRSRGTFHQNGQHQQGHLSSQY